LWLPFCVFGIQNFLTRITYSPLAISRLDAQRPDRWSLENNPQLGCRKEHSIYAGNMIDP
jgi:hypothetical protein